MKIVLILIIITLSACNSDSQKNEVETASKVTDKQPISQSNTQATINKQNNKPEINWTGTGRYKTSNHLVKDVKSGLIWMRCAMGQQWNGGNCTGEVTKKEWADAMQQAEEFTDESGHNDWRLPTDAELKSLINCSNGNTPDFSGNDYVCGSGYDEPVIDAAIFPNTVSLWHWTSIDKATSWSKSSNDGKKDVAIVIDFTDGGDGEFDKLHKYHSRLVRSNP